MKSIQRGLIAAAVCTAMASAHADNLFVDYDYLGLTFDYGPVVLTFGGPPSSLTASPFLVSNLTLANSFEAFCMEPFQALSIASVSAGPGETYTAGPVVSANAAAIQALYNSYYSTTLSTPVSAAAFQFALWELVSDTVPNMHLGPNFGVSSLDPAGILAQQMLVGSAPQSPALYTLVQWSSAASQDMIQAVPVPEPGTYALMLAGLAGVATWARRQRA